MRRKGGRKKNWNRMIRKTRLQRIKKRINKNQETRKENGIVGRGV